VSRLQTLARREATRREAALEHCELCGEPIPSEHRHLLDLRDRELLCSCRACSLLFADPAAGAGRYKLVSDRRLRLDGFAMSDAAWEELRLPVDIAFLFHSTPEGRVVAFYPSPMGPTESQLRLAAWEQLEATNPVLATMAPDVEALLVNRARGARRAWLVGIDECYALVGLIRTRWRGLTGGKEVWQAITEFFEDLDRRSRQEATWHT
jgi:Family of unknown function (DUF5947)